MRARGVGTVASYAALLEAEPEEVARLLHTLSVRVTEFFRNPDTWQRLLEILRQGGFGSGGRLTAWSMGCATGEEAWTLAMLLMHYGERNGGQPPAAGLHIFASDVDADALAVAAAGRYPAATAAAIRHVIGTPYGSIDQGQFLVADAVRHRVLFRREDLTAASPPAGWCDVVCCRNVLIFLSREGQRRMLEKAFTALRPGGLLVLGRTESLVALPHAALEHVDTTHRIFQRAG